MSQEIDIDWMAVTVNIGDLARMFGTWLTVELCSFVPPLRENPDFREWICVISSPFVLTVPNLPDLKENVIRALYKDFGIVTRASEFPKALTAGRQHVTMDTIIGVLCDLVSIGRVVQYGMKAPWVHLKDHDDLLRNHPNSMSNSFDVAQSFNSNDDAEIPLVKLPSVFEGETFPMFGPVGRGYGSLKILYQGCSIKIYPRAVHSLKAYASNLSMRMPKTSATMRKKEETLLGVKRWVQDHSEMLGGLRIEVRVTTRCVEDAVEFVIERDLLKIDTWNTLLGDDWLIWIPVSEYLQNLEDIMRCARPIFRSDNNQKPGCKRLAKYRDVMNAFGYNPGWRGRLAPITNLEEAWWSANSQETEEILVENTKEDVSALYEKYKTDLRCDDGHEGFHKVGEKGRFRVRCSDYPRCKVSWSKNQLLDRIWQVQKAQDVGSPTRLEEEDEDEEEPADPQELRRIRQEVRFVKRGPRWTWKNHKGRWTTCGSFETLEDCVKRVWQVYERDWRNKTKLA